MKPLNTRTLKLTALVSAAILLVGWLVASTWDHREPGVLLTHADAMPQGTVRLVDGYWVARLPSGEFRVFLNEEPRSEEPRSHAKLQWFPRAEELHLRWDFLWSGGPFITRQTTPKALFAGPVYGELYTIEGKCVGGPCDPRGLFVVPTRVEGNQLRLSPGQIRRLNDQG